MRVAVIGDLHLGKTLYGYDLTPHVRLAMYEFLEMCLHVRAEAAVCLGDVYDRPAPSVALQKMVVQWANEFERAGVDLYLLAGNHDVTSSTAAPSALESIRVAAPFKHVRAVDRPLVAPGVGLLLPFPSPGIYASQADYLADTPPPADVVYAHLTVAGAKVGEQDFPYRGGDHPLPEDVLRRAGAVLLGHIHKPQRLGNVVVVGAAERTSYAERSEERRFALLQDDDLIIYKRAALPLLQFEPDVSSWGTGGEPPTTEQVLAGMAPKVAGALVKLAPFVDERSVVDWPAVERGLLEAGALAVTIAPAVRVHKAAKRLQQDAVAADPVVAAARFIKQRVEDKHERKRLLDTFKQIQKEVDHAQGEVRG